jgi:hypothetical protein
MSILLTIQNLAVQVHRVHGFNVLPSNSHMPRGLK